MINFPTELVSWKNTGNKKVSFMLKKSCWKKKMIGVATRTSTKSLAPARVAVVDDLMQMGRQSEDRIIKEVLGFLL